MIVDCWLLIVDIVHTENTEGNGGPQADCGVERKLSGINRELKEMGPQADEVRIQVSINDDWLLIIHTLYIFSGVHQATQVFDDWLMMTD